MIKFLIGGSPCTHWSIAQSKDRETTAEGIGWELFRNYLIAKEKFNPDFFLYENNKSAAQPIKDQIAVELGAPLQYINSALVSAQNRQRFYCHNFGDVPQPEDRGILLRDILESGMPILPTTAEKSRTVDSHYHKLESGTWYRRVYNENPAKQQHDYIAVPVEKAYCLKAQYPHAMPEDVFKRRANTMVAEPVDYVPHNGSDIVITENSMRLQRQDPKHSTIQGSHVTFDDAKAQTLGTSHIPMTFEQLTFEAIADRDKAECLRATYDHSGVRNFEENIIRTKGYEGVAVRIGTIENNAKNQDFDSQQYCVYSPCGKSVTICGQGGGVGAKTGLYACPIDADAPARPIYEVQNGLITIKGKQYPMPVGYPVGDVNGKAYCLTDNYKNGPYPEHTLSKGVRTMVAIPVDHEQLTFEAIADRDKAECIRATYDHSEVRNFEENIIRTKGYEGVPVRVGQLPDYKQQAGRIYSVGGKSVTLKATDGGGGAATGLYACHCPIDEAGKTYPVYTVQSGLITIKGKQFPIKLPDGYYIIRKLTVTECCRLQTLPDDYCRAVSATQGYKGLGNGWTAEVIIHLLAHALKGVPKSEEIVVLSMYDGIGTGRYCFDALGYHNITYYAYEIDKPAMKVSNSNYPDIIQCGDAFGVRADSWELPRCCIERVG